MLPPNCTKKKSEYRIHETLHNGQHFNLYFIRTKTDTTMRQWEVYLHISETRKEANIRFSSGSKRFRNTITTGKVGLTGLKKALDYIVEFSKIMEINEELIIGWEDDKRRSAYQWLKRKGFIDYLSDEGEVIALGIRNPEFWEYI